MDALPVQICDHSWFTFSSPRSRNWRPSGWTDPALLAEVLVPYTSRELRGIPSLQLGEQSGQ